MRPLSRLAQMLLVCAFLATGCARLDLFKRSETSNCPPSDQRVGTVAPDFDGEDFEGKQFKLSEYRGKVVVVAFWASQCKPCREMIPYERALAERYRDRPFVMLGVNLDTDSRAARKVIATDGITWRCCQAGGWDSAIAKGWKIEAIPALFVIDADGVIRLANVHGKSLDRAVESIVVETEKKRTTS